jgi:hypothetical protein
MRTLMLTAMLTLVPAVAWSAESWTCSYPGAWPPPVIVRYTVEGDTLVDASEFKTLYDPSKQRVVDNCSPLVLRDREKFSRDRRVRCDH